VGKAHHRRADGADPECRQTRADATQQAAPADPGVRDLLCRRRRSHRSVEPKWHDARLWTMLARACQRVDLPDHDPLCPWPGSTGRSPDDDCPIPRSDRVGARWVSRVATKRRSGCHHQRAVLGGPAGPDPGGGTTARTGAGIPPRRAAAMASAMRTTIARRLITLSSVESKSSSGPRPGVRRSLCTRRRSDVAGSEQQPA